LKRPDHEQTIVELRQQLAKMQQEVMTQKEDVIARHLRSEQDSSELRQLLARMQQDIKGLNDKVHIEAALKVSDQTLQDLRNRIAKME